jgi:Kef-type K+ transport system membrane component KefB
MEKENVTLKTRPLIDALILFVLFVSLAAMMDLTRQRSLPWWTWGFPILALVIAYRLGKATGRRERSEDSATRS